MPNALTGIASFCLLVASSALLVWHIDASVAPGVATQALAIGISSGLIAVASFFGAVKSGGGV